MFEGLCDCRCCLSRSGSESLEGVSTSKAPALRDDIVPVVWSFSRLQSAATSKMMIETAGDDPLRELMQVLKRLEQCSMLLCRECLSRCRNLGGMLYVSYDGIFLSRLDVSI